MPQTLVEADLHELISQFLRAEKPMIVVGQMRPTTIDTTLIKELELSSQIFFNSPDDLFHFHNYRVEYPCPQTENEHLLV